MVLVLVSKIYHLLKKPQIGKASKKSLANNFSTLFSINKTIMGFLEQKVRKAMDICKQCPLTSKVNVIGTVPTPKTEKAEHRA